MELDKSIALNIGYKYILDIKDCFSKWLWSYPLPNKEGVTVLRNIKNYFLAFGKSKIIQTDNGLEFNNSLSELSYENNDIKHINSSPRCPESNGQVESLHKTMQKEIYLSYREKGDEFNIFDCINDCLELYNYQIVHTTTGFIPFYLKDIKDESIIEAVKKNIIQCYERFHKTDNTKFKVNDKYLLIENGNINKKSKIFYPKSKKVKKLIYSILVFIDNSKNGGLIRIKIAVKNKFYPFNEEFRVNYKYLRKYSEDLWNNLFKKYNN